VKTATGRNTYKAQRSKAWLDGFNLGHAGNSSASPPYLVASQTERLIWEWKEGHRLGLEEYAREVEQARLEKVKRVDAMRGPR
jgi:hypothetical protein